MTNPGESSPPAYFFLHIYKTAGTSINHTLKSFFPEEKRCPAWSWPRLLALPKESLSTYELFWGHLGGDLAGFLGRELREFTVLRDPVDRAISHYHQRLRERGPHLAPFYAAAGSFSAAIRMPELRDEFCNFQARHLAQHIWPRMHPAYTRFIPPDAELLAAAQQRLDGMECVGVTERLWEFVTVLCHTFDWDKPLEELRLNVNPTQEAAVVSTADREVLVGMNAIDLALYRSADARLTLALEAMLRHCQDHPEIWEQRFRRRISKVKRLSEAFDARLSGQIEQLRLPGVRLGLSAGHAMDRLLPSGRVLRRAVQPARKLLGRIAGWS